MSGEAAWGVLLATAPGMSQRADSLDELMTRYAGGDASAFEPIYRMLSAPLNRFCLRLASRRPEAEDLFQDTFLKLHRARSTYVPRSNTLHWSYAIARSLYVSGVRYRRRRPEELGTEEEIGCRAECRADGVPAPDAEIAAEHLANVVTAELRRMSEKNRTAYVLLKEEGLSTRDVAALLGTRRS